MTKVFSSQNLPEVELLSSILEDSGITITVKNRYLYATRGEVPFTETWPEIWLLRDDDLPQAQAILAADQNRPAEDAQDWICPNCGENIEGQFTTCWNCGADRPA